MKIALVNPPLSLLRHERFLAMDPWFPLGLGYLAAYLRRGGHEVRLYDPDASKLPMGRFWPELEAFRPDVFGVSGVTLSHMIARELVAEAKRRLGCLTVMGGPHASSLPRSTLLAAPGLDAVIIGEGELPMLRLAGDFDRTGRADPGSVPGAAWLENGEYRQNPQPEPLGDLDSLPYPARDLVDMGPYERCRSWYGKGKMATILTSRGCPSQCTFCANPPHMGRRFRPRAPGPVVAEMEHLVRTYGIRHFFIADDCFSIDAGRVAEFCGLLKQKKLRVTWQASGRVNTLLDDALLAKMRRSGCVRVLLGIESGDRRILELMKKGASLEQAKECCSKLRRHGISAHTSFILGAEGETFGTMLRTFFFAKRLAAVLGEFNVLCPFPGTEIFERYYKDFDAPETDWTDWGSMLYRRPYPPRHTKLSWFAQKTCCWAANLLYYLEPYQFTRLLIGK